jgi:hypothetical protein
MPVVNAEADVDAHLDPWCLVPLETGESILFGYARHHAKTGGLAWLSSSEVLDLQEVPGRAVTRSGRRYLLGRQFEAIDVGAEGEEARLAFELLIGREYEDLDALVEVDRRWLMAKKAARHLGIEPPVRTDSATRGFFDRHAAAYFAVRRRGKGTTS